VTTDTDTIARALAEPFEPRQLKWKPQTVRGDKALGVAYVSASDVMNRLDKTVGVANWKDRYQVLSTGSVICRLSVRIGDEWVTKSDVGSPSEQPDEHDRMKAAFSDALKRAAVRFGVARYLHYLPAVWISYDAQRKRTDMNNLPALPSWAQPSSNGKAVSQ
jgi:hypothetical protein